MVIVSNINDKINNMILQEMPSHNTWEHLDLGDILDLKVEFVINALYLHTDETLVMYRSDFLIFSHRQRLSATIFLFFDQLGCKW